MFSLKEWNFEEYKDEIKEIPDPVERMDEINATYGMTFIERENSDKYIGSKRFSDSQNKLINNRFDKFQAWALNEIESMKIRFSKEIENKKKKAWEGHIRLPFPVVWDRDSYNIIEPDVRKKGKKKEWINWLLKNLNEGNGKKWTYEQWVLNAMENEDYYLGFAEHEYEINYPSILVGALDDQFIVFLFNVQKVLSLKDEKKKSYRSGTH